MIKVILKKEKEKKECVIFLIVLLFLMKIITFNQKYFGESHLYSSNIKAKKLILVCRVLLVI